MQFNGQVGTGPVIRAVTDPTASLPVTIDDGTRKYVWGLGLTYAVNGSSIEVQHADRLGSIRAVSDGTGAVIATYRTDEFGIPTASTGSAGSPFRYTGEPLDASGLTYLRARHYDPSIGRFMSRDPFAGFSASPLSIPRVLRVAGSVVGDLAIEFEGGHRLETFRDHAILADREDWRFLMEDDDWVFEGGRLELVS